MKKHGAGGHNWGQDESENQLQKAESIGEELAEKQQNQLEAEANDEVGEMRLTRHTFFQGRINTQS